MSGLSGAFGEGVQAPASGVQPRGFNRAYLSIASVDVQRTSDHEMFGHLAANLPFAVEPSQGAAWKYQIGHLRSLARELPDAHFFLEFLIRGWAGVPT